MKILMTAFDAFGGETINPAREAVWRVTPPAGVELFRLEVPTVFGKSVQVVAEEMARLQPDVVLCIGQAGGRAQITPERVAINLMDATIADNAGYTPVDVPVLPSGENALFATVPVKQMVQAIQLEGIPARLSCTAGTFVCNQLLYGVLELCQKQYPATRAGFIHMPFLPEQTVSKPNLPSMPLADMVKALEAVLVCLAETR